MIAVMNDRSTESLASGHRGAHMVKSNDRRLIGGYVEYKSLSTDNGTVAHLSSTPTKSRSSIRNAGGVIR